MGEGLNRFALPVVSATCGALAIYEAFNGDYGFATLNTALAVYNGLVSINSSIYDSKKSKAYKS